MNWMDYGKKLESGEIPIHAHGHQGAYLEPRKIALDIMVTLPGVENEVSFPATIKGKSYAPCHVCGNASDIVCYEDRVEVEDNHSEQEPFTVEIKFPTGDMIFNDTYPQDQFEESEFGIGSIPGMAKVGQDMAKQGLLHFFVGNSCPVVWREGDTVLFGRMDRYALFGPDRVGSICTDLWWASFVDRKTLEDLQVPEKEIDHMRKKGGSIQVTPGTYRCTSYYHLGGMDYAEDERQVYGKLELLPG